MNHATTAIARTCLPANTSDHRGEMCLLASSMSEFTVFNCQIRRPQQSQWKIVFAGLPADASDHRGKMCLNKF